MMLFAQTSDATVLATVLVMLAGSGGVIAFLFRALISSKDREYALLLAQKEKEALELKAKTEERESVLKSYQEVAVEAIRSATDTANYYRQKEGKPPLIIAAPVVSESHSDSTKAQREAAFIATMRATLANIKLEAGQSPRPEPAHAVEPDTFPP